MISLRAIPLCQRCLGPCPVPMLLQRTACTRHGRVRVLCEYWGAMTQCLVGKTHLVVKIHLVCHVVSTRSGRLLWYFVRAFVNSLLGS